MRTDICWAELHAPLFLAGTNLGQKIDPAKRQGVKMQYDEERRHLYVSYNGKEARVPEPSILSMVEGKASVAQAAKATSASPMNTPSWPAHAQVSTPFGHVFQGEGHGQTGQEPPKVMEPERKKPGRKPKVEL